MDSFQRPTKHSFNAGDASIVVGSGPAGVACAWALLAQGKSVVMLDAGTTLEPHRWATAEKLQRQEPSQWTGADLAEYQAGMIPDVGGVPLKLVYGSDYAYRGADEHLGVHYENVGLRPSLALGGLSNVWGAAMMPYLDQDLEGWPVRMADLAEHYAAVLGFTGLAARRDDLEALFPLHTSQFTDLRPSKQAQRFLDNLDRHRAALASSGIHFGRSRLAVKGSDRNGGAACVYCRLCMYGCPYGYIYSSAHTLPRLMAQPQFRYEPNVVVTSVREQGSSAVVAGYDPRTRVPVVREGTRVFLAAGAIATTGILLRSLEAYDRPAVLKDSQYFLLPLALTRRIKGASREWLHALSQVFLEIVDPATCRRSVHIQVYSNNDLIGQAVRKTFGPLAGALEFLARNLEDRLLIAQGFLHSDHSSQIEVRLKQTGDKGTERLELTGVAVPESRRIVHRLVRKLLRHAPQMGAAALPMMLKIAEPGRGFHTGGSFPMAAKPQGFETDILGRVPGWQRVHAVDSTIFPSIPATTITFSVMANAHRIGWEMGAAEGKGRL